MARTGRHRKIPDEVGIWGWEKTPRQIADEYPVSLRTAQRLVRRSQLRWRRLLAALSNPGAGGASINGIEHRILMTCPDDQFEQAVVFIEDELEIISSRTCAGIGKQESRNRLTAGSQGEYDLYTRTTMSKGP